MKLILTLFFLYSGAMLCAQHETGDSTRILQEVIIEAYQTNRSLNEVPASIGILKSQDLRRFSNTSILPAVNVIPGVRMEQRSPGSYRFSIRGSSLRSPYGVRNVKAYWNGLPFTDGGGNTYLNLLDFDAIGSMEIIKGPGGSLYGAGTGGVLLLNSPKVAEDQIQATAVAGSFGLQRYLVGGRIKAERISANLQLSHQRSDGYREQTALKRNAINADVKFPVGDKGTLTSTLIFSNLFYETPGGLTKAQFESDPSQARPPSGFLGAVEAKAAVSNETTFGGFIYDRAWSNQWSTSTAIYGGFSAFENPTIRNYEARDETNAGLRTHTIYRIFRSQSSVGGKITFGGEYQYFASPIAVYDNDGSGNRAAVQVRDKVTASGGLIFAQGDLELPGDFFVTAGASVNFLYYRFLRREPAPTLNQHRPFDVVISPRLAVLKEFSERLSLFASYSDGFSPPSLAEVRPATNTFSDSLKAEIGNNLEVGARGTLLDGKLGYDVVLYDFRLRNTIVVQRNQDDADYFINAGKTSQRGIETLISYQLTDEKRGRPDVELWASYAYQRYRFKEYGALNEDYSGNALTGVAPHVLSAGLDLALDRRLTTNVTFNYVDKIPLNDANTAFADAYTLLGLRVGWTTYLQQEHRVELFAGIDNALDEVYSLGNDLNAFGGRYYNAAMPRNYYAGISILLGSEQ